MIEETGIGIRNPLWFVGVVEKRDDPRKEGRVQVRAFGVHGTVAQVPTESLPWAICISGNYDPNYPIPPLNSWVFGFFIDGRDAQQPMILGLIPTQMTSLIDPETNGWGVIPTSNVNLQSQGSRAIDYGQPQLSRKARNEDIQNTDILFQEVNRLSADFSSIEEGFTIEEPSPGYCAVYPLNRVMETAGGHSFELDDSPGAERIRLWHSKGAYVEMHQSGVVVVKATNDLWLGAEGNICIVSKSRQLIKVEGDAVMSVDGNMALEVKGDMRTTVNGNYELSVGGQLNLNGSDAIQARAAKITLESNVEGVNIKAAKKINIQSGEVMNVRSEAGILQEAVGDINIKSDNHYIQTAGAMHIKAGDAIFQEAAADINIKGDNLFIQGTTDTNIKSAQVFLDATGNMNIKAAYTKIGNGQISLKGTSVAIDEFVYLASGESVTAPGGTGAIAAEEALPAFPAEGTENLAEPVAKSAGNGNGSGSFMYGYKNVPLSGGSGAISQDGDPDAIPVVSRSYVPGDYSDLESALRAQGFTENEILATLAVAEGESGLDYTKTENSWVNATPPYKRMREFFKTRIGPLSDEEIGVLKSNDVTFFNYVYSGRLGNGTSNDDGYNYRGRSFIQLTGKSNYTKYAKITGYDIVNNPDLLITDKRVAAAVTTAYLNDRIGKRSDDPVSDIRGAVAGGKKGTPGYDLSIDGDRARYARRLKERERGTAV